MSHFSVLVIGPNPDAQLAGYDENLEVESYMDECYDCCGEAKYQPCSTCNNTGKAMSTRNPQGMWDYWRVGGRYRGLLRLLPGRPGTLGELSYEWTFDGPCAEDWTGRADQALRGDIDLDALRKACTADDGSTYRTYAVVAEGAWKGKAEMGWFGMPRTEPMPEEKWVAFWDHLVEGLPPDTLLTVVDCHV